MKKRLAALLALIRANRLLALLVLVMVANSLFQMRSDSRLHRIEAEIYGSSGADTLRRVARFRRGGLRGEVIQLRSELDDLRSALDDLRSDVEDLEWDRR